jgi:hypothetical protein
MASARSDDRNEFGPAGALRHLSTFTAPPSVTSDIARTVVVMDGMLATVWTSLEIVKLVVGVLTPIAVVILGVFVARATARIEQTQWASQKVVEYRLKVFEIVAPKLNRLLCFYTFVGRWKETSPADVLVLKRELDEEFYVNRMLFSPELFDSYQGFMELLFKTYAATDRDALLRSFVTTEFGDRRLLGWWQSSSEQLFAQTDIPSVGDVVAAYDRLGQAFRSELYIPTAGLPAG